MKNTIIATTSTAIFAAMYCYIPLYCHILFSLLLIAATFSTPWLWQKNVFSLKLLRSLHFDYDKNRCFHFSTTCATPWSWQKKIFFFISVQRSLRRNHQKKKIYIYIFKKLFSLLLLRALHRDHDKRNYFYLTTTSITSWLRKKIVVFISALCSPRLDHDWKYFYFHSNTTFTTR